MRIFIVESLWHEKKGFILDRDTIGEQYIFIHFLTPVTAELNGESVDIKPGGCVVFGKNSRQHFSSPNCELVHDWFHADVDCAELMKKYGLMCEKVYYPYNAEDITKTVSKIKLEYAVRDAYYEQSASAAAESIFISLARSEIKEAEGVQPYSLIKERFIEARAKIHMDICRQWTVADMASLVNMSESRFYYMYKKLFGISPQADLSAKRIQTAQMLLTKKQLSVKETAQLTGFNSEYNFIRRFKQIMGITPGQTAKNEIKIKKIK